MLWERHDFFSSSESDSFFPSTLSSDQGNSKKKGFLTETKPIYIVNGTVKLLFLQCVIQRTQPPTR